LQLLFLAQDVRQIKVLMGDDCPFTNERAIENEEYLKAQAKALNIRYVDYLHLITKHKMESKKALTTSNK
jgi:hypothetical protein